MKTCAACPHPRAAHHLPDGGCRLNGCGCQAYRDGEGATSGDGEARVVAIEIPAGYALTVTLVPVGSASPEAIRVPDGSAPPEAPDAGE